MNGIAIQQKTAIDSNSKIPLASKNGQISKNPKMNLFLAKLNSSDLRKS